MYSFHKHHKQLQLVFCPCYQCSVDSKSPIYKLTHLNQETVCVMTVRSTGYKLNIVFTDIFIFSITLTVWLLI